MAAATLVIGIDYGTESARGALLDADTGALIATHRHAYAHGVMVDALADGTALPPQWALQDADDYLTAADDILGVLADAARAAGGEIAGIGIDATASTPLPARADLAPLSRDYPDRPHAYAKLWKHHAAQPWADQLDASCAAFLQTTGGQTSCEWLPAKAGQLAAEAPDLWAETERFIEAGDWIVSQLVAAEVRSACQAGYKAHYQPHDGYPDALDDLAPGLRARLQAPRPVGEAAGRLCPKIASRTGIAGAPAVAVATIDAHAVVPAVGVSGAGAMVCALGTSACHLLVDPQFYTVPGVAGAVRDGIVPGAWGYESGQAGFGDILAWFVGQFPAGDESDPFAGYEARAAERAAGAAGVVALDWWNGCRTPLMDPDLSGLFFGLTLNTRASDLYRALLESLCFGTRRIIETLEAGGLGVERLVLTGGLAERSPLLNRLLTDVTARRAFVPAVSEATARGAAIHAAVAAGVAANFDAAVVRLGATDGDEYTPDPKTRAVYDALYGVYRQIGDRIAAGDEAATLARLQNEARDR